MKHFYIINGPNLNLLGQRNPEIYGTHTLSDLEKALDDYVQDRSVKLSHFQSNHEGALIDWLHQAHHQKIDGVLLNAGAYTHYSYALHDAIEAIQVPVIEVHLSDIASRIERWRHTSVIAPVVTQSFKGDGIQSYFNAIDYLLDLSD